PDSPLFPYTTLFRSRPSFTSTSRADLSRHTLSLTVSPGDARPMRLDSWPERTMASPLTSVITSPAFRPAFAAGLSDATRATRARSEEHTSELQSRVD